MHLLRQITHLVPLFTNMKMSEHDLVCMFRDQAHREVWEFYPENQLWDFLMQDKKTGTQVAFQAKLKINSNVIEQCTELLQSTRWRTRVAGPHYAAVLIPFSETQVKGFEKFKKRCSAHKLLIFTEKDVFAEIQPDWEPYRRSFAEPVWVPPFVPDLPAGVKSPRSVTPFKVGVVRLCQAIREGLQPTHKQIREYNAGSVQYWVKYLKRLPGRPAKFAVIDLDALPDLHDFKDVAEGIQRQNKEPSPGK